MFKTRRQSPCISGALVWLAVVLMCTARSSFGQFIGFGNVKDLYEPPYLVSDLPLLVEQLKLDDLQQPIIETLLTEFQETFELAAQETRDALNESGPRAKLRGDGRNVGTQRTLIDQIRKIRQRMRDVQASDSDEKTKTAQLAKLEQQLVMMRKQMDPASLPGAVDDGAVPAVLEAVRLGEQWIARRASLTDQLVTDIRSLVSEEQFELWPAVDRVLRRERTMSRGRFSGENIDLIKLTGQLSCAAEHPETSASLLSDYAVVLDDTLRARNIFLIEASMRQMRAMYNQDIRLASSLVNREIQLRIAVRDTNERFINLIAEALDDQCGALLLQTFREHAYAGVYRPTVMQGVFSRAKTLRGLDESTLQSITALQEAFQEQLLRKNLAVVDAMHEQEPRAAQQRVQRMLGSATGQRMERTEDIVRLKLANRDDLDWQYREQLERLLTPEQVAVLPRMPKRRPLPVRSHPESIQHAVPEATGVPVDIDERRQWMLDNFDLDGDGELSVEEIQAAEETSIDDDSDTEFPESDN